MVGIRYRELAVGLIGGLGFFSFGATASWLTPLVYIFKHYDFHMTSNEISSLAIMNGLGALMCSIPTSYLADMIGRKPILLLSGPLWALSWLLILFLRNKIVLFAMRFLQGILSATTANTVTLYVSEISSAKDRGSLICQMITWWHVGNLYIYVMALFFGYSGLTLSALIPCIIFGILVFWCPESPYYLLGKNKNSEAEKVVAWLRHGSSLDPQLKQEVSQMSQAVKKDQIESAGAFKNVIVSRKDRKALAIVNMLSIAYALVGSGTILTYASDTVATLSGSVDLSNYTTAILGFLMTIVTVPSVLLSDKLGRRPLLIGSTAASFVLFSATTILFYYTQKIPDSPSYLRTISFACLVGGVCVNTFGLETLRVVAAGELFSTAGRTVPIALSNVVLTVFETGSIYLYEYIEDQGALYLNFVMYALFSLLGAVGIYCFLPETKGKTFAEIQASL